MTHEIGSFVNGEVFTVPGSCLRFIRREASMKKKSIPPLFKILFLIFFTYGCSVKGIRSPIVFRSPVVSEKKSEPQEPPQTSVSPPSRETARVEKSSVPEGEQVLSAGSIKIVSSDDLLHVDFKILGEVSVRDRSRTGFTQEEVIRALKTKAFRNYRGQAKGLVNVQLVKKEKVFYYTKVRRSISTPKEPNTYEKASAEVVAWDEES